MHGLYNELQSTPEAVPFITAREARQVAIQTQPAFGSRDQITAKKVLEAAREASRLNAGRKLYTYPCPVCIHTPGQCSLSCECCNFHPCGHCHGSGTVHGNILDAGLWTLEEIIQQLKAHPPEPKKTRRKPPAKPKKPSPEPSLFDRRKRGVKAK